MANGLPIDLETFEALPEKKQNVAIYKVLVHMVQAGFESEVDRWKKRELCEQRFTALESRKNLDRGLATGTGFLGGFLAYLLNKLGIVL